MSQDQRLIEIETKIAFQDQTIQELNQVVFEQQNQLDALSKKLDQLKQRFDAGQGDEPVVDMPPPHY